MSEPQAMHVSDERLVRFADGELEAADRRTASAHIDGCEECRARLEAITLAGREYLEFHHDVLRRGDPAPPREWNDLRQRFKEIDASRSHAHGGQRALWIGAAAAAVVAAAGLYFWMARTGAVSAAELLRKAEAAEAAPSPARRIRVRSRSRNVVRPASLPSVGREESAPELEALFVNAHFSWRDPFSARSFNAWRVQLPDRKDRVTASAAKYEIQTTTESGPLREAVLTLDARDLRPLRETLRFAGEEVEISEASSTESSGREEALAAAPPVLASKAAGPAEELRVVAALHRIGADLGEPVQIVRRNGSLVVEGTGLTATREQEIRQAVTTIPGVEVRFEAAEAGPLGQTPSARQTASGIRGRMDSLLGEDGVNRILDASEALMARAFALRGLSRRFPPSVEAQLADADRNILAELRGEYVSGIASHLNTLKVSLRPAIAEGIAAAPPASGGSWQSDAERLFGAAQRVDRLINRALAGAEEFRQLAPELAAALRELAGEVER